MFLLDGHGARVHTKLRLADAVSIDTCWLDTKHPRYALSAHLDFVIADAEHNVKFAVEFDGPTHAYDPRVVERDSSTTVAATEKMR